MYCRSYPAPRKQPLVVTMSHPRSSGLLAILTAICMFAPGARAADVVVKRFDVGAGPNAVGMVDASEDTEVAVPQALYAADSGELYLLDQVNSRVLRFDPKQPAAATRSLELPSELEPTDLVVLKNDLFVWDGEVRALRPTGREDAPVRGLEEYQTRAADDEFTLSAFAQMGSQKASGDTDLLDENTRSVRDEKRRTPARQAVSSRGRGPVIATITPDQTGSGVQIEVRAQGQSATLARFPLKVRDKIGVAEFLDIDRQGRMFVLAENIPELAIDPPLAFVARFAPTGALEGIYELPLSQSIALSRRFVTIDPNGEVYFLRTRKGAVDVVGVGFRVLRNAKVIDVRPAHTYTEPAGNTWQGKGPIAAVRPLSRRQVIETAFAFESINWRVNPSAYGRDPDTACTAFNRVRRPGYLHGKVGQQVRGIPYCWGCHGSLSQIRTRLERGMLAGNWCTRNEPRRDTAGVDCSAFVSATWGLSTHFTTRAIPAITTHLASAWDMLPGDALNKPASHVMLFLRFTPDRKVEVIEAATGSCNGRVCRNVYPMSALLARGYSPVRFKAIANDAVAKAAEPEPPKPAARRKSR
jgi:hypothetical protein